jgi:hypothetical protein
MGEIRKMDDVLEGEKRPCWTDDDGTDTDSPAVTKRNALSFRPVHVSVCEGGKKKWNNLKISWVSCLLDHCGTRRRPFL